MKHSPGSVSALLYSLGILARLEPPCLRKNAESCYTSLAPLAVTPDVAGHPDTEQPRYDSALPVIVRAIAPDMRDTCGNDIPLLVAPVNRT